jgi:hypothetical protein
MFRRLAIFLIAATSSYALHAAAPENFLGAWSIDHETTMRAVDASDPPLSPELRDRMVKGLQGPLNGLLLEIDEKSMSLKTAEGTMAFSLVLEEEEDNRAVFSSTEAGTVTLTLDSEERLNFRTSQDDDFDLVYFQRQGSGAGTSTASPQSDSVAFLDSLRSCEPGIFHISYPGFGTSKNSIVGKNGDRCQVSVEHSQINLICNYSDATIALLTTEAKYEDARKGVLSGSTSSEESQRVAEECSPE